MERKEMTAVAAEQAPMTFLDALAKAYADRYKDISDFCFVFPNKRSRTFFLKALTRQIGERTILSPEAMDITEFMSHVSGVDAASRIDLIFRLYRAYCKLKGKKDMLTQEDDILDFDSFLPWGEIVLQDFSEVEQYAVDASSLFKNVKDYRDIASNFLTEEQIEVIERYFGYTPDQGDVEGFWRSVGGEEERNDLKNKFMELWQVLPELFAAVTGELADEGLALPGGVFRKAMERVEGEDYSSLTWKRVVFAGFNSLSTTEARLFTELQKLEGDDGEPYADFHWDATGPVLTSGVGPASASLKKGQENFPPPAWAAPVMKLANKATMPGQIREDASPSNSMQAKIASMRVEEWIADLGHESIENADAAVVIPDENLLIPLLYSLPDSLKSVNLTMGYSMRFTSVASFMYQFRRLQSRRRAKGDESGFYYEDLRLFLAHPLTHVVIGSEAASEINGYMQRFHKKRLSVPEIEKISEVCADILRPIPADIPPVEAIDMVDEVLLRIDVALAGGGRREAQVNDKLERSLIAVYRDALKRLRQSLDRYGVRMHFTNVFHLVDRILAGETVTFEGKPLEGLQVMGLLETRAIDFRHLVILSMNDKVMPRRSRKMTFIPDSLRRGYGLPTSRHSESLYAYYFYRLLSRAEDVTLIYDARAGEGMRSGGKSRFLLQLEMLHSRGKIEHRDYGFKLSGAAGLPQGVEKSPAVMRKLEDFTKKEDGRNLSASAIMKYTECPVKFYYNVVAGLSDDPEPKDYIDPITHGNIIHAVLQRLYLPDKKMWRKILKNPEVFSRAHLQAILEDDERLETLMRREINRLHFHREGKDLDMPLKGQAELVAERFMEQVRDVVRYDMEHAPLTLIGEEVEEVTRMKFGNSPEVNMKCAFDRIDYTDGKYRVVDYKTGGSHVAADHGFSDMLEGDYKSKYIKQLLLYSDMLERKMLRERGIETGGIRSVIYDVNKIGETGPVVPTIEKKEVLSHEDVKEGYNDMMEQIVTDIFDPEKPFEPTADENRCAYCIFKSLCGKE